MPTDTPVTTSTQLALLSQNPLAGEAVMVEKAFVTTCPLSQASVLSALLERCVCFYRSTYQPPQIGVTLPCFSSSRNWPFKGQALYMGLSSVSGISQALNIHLLNKSKSTPVLFLCIGERRSSNQDKMKPVFT